MVIEMAVGKSGRIVIEIQPDVKEELYDALSSEGRSLKSWFLENVDEFLADKSQMKLELVPPDEGGRAK